MVHTTDLFALRVRRFRMCARAQQTLIALEVHVLQAAYRAFGAVRDDDASRASPAEFFNVVMPASFGSARRKPVTCAFQRFCDDHYMPLLTTFLFGARYDRFAAHLFALKVSTLPIGADECYYGRPIYHMHLDHRIGTPTPKDKTQVKSARVLFSTVRDDDRKPVANAGTTVYLRRQPSRGFARQADFHRYMADTYPERGHAQGLKRPLYEVREGDQSHPGVPIHAEANPCPQGRCLYVIDVRDDVQLSSGGRFARRTDLPLDEMIVAMAVLDDEDSDAFRARVRQLREAAHAQVAAWHPPDRPGRDALRALCAAL